MCKISHWNFERLLRKQQLTLGDDFLPHLVEWRSGMKTYENTPVFSLHSSSSSLRFWDVDYDQSSWQECWCCRYVVSAAGAPHQITRHVSDQAVCDETGCTPVSQLINRRPLHLFDHTAWSDVERTGPLPPCSMCCNW